MRSLIALALILLAAPAQAADLSVAFAGDPSLVATFTASLHDAAKEQHTTIAVVDKAQATYTILVAQESTVGSAAAAVFALDAKGQMVASVVRSGRMSSRGALNACAKELLKRLK